MDMPTIAIDQPTPRSRRVALVAALVVAFASFAPAASAQPAGPSSTQEAEADALFQRANELVAKKDFAAACPLFEQAYHLAGGGGTAQNLAICYEDLGKVAQAYRAFAELRRVSASPPRPDRIKLAEERMARLEPRLSRLRVRVPEARRSAETLVTVDGDTYGDKALEEGIVVDVGPHVVKVVSPGKKPLELSRTIAQEGSVEVVDIPAGDPAPAPEAAPPGRETKRRPPATPHAPPGSCSAEQASPPSWSAGCSASSPPPRTRPPGTPAVIRPRIKA